MDNREAIRIKTYEAQSEAIAVNAQASLFDVPGARAHVAQLRVKADELDALLDELSFDEGSGELVIKPFPVPMVIQYGSPVAYQFEAVGGQAPYRWGWTGITPFGVTLSPDGLMSGTMLQFPGRYVVFIQVVDSGDPLHTYSAALDLQVTPA